MSIFKTRRFFQNLCCLLLLATVAFSVRAQEITVQVGSGSGTNLYIPIRAYYGYSYTQTIYNATELSTAGAITNGVITKIRYKVSGAPGANSNNWTVYLGNTTKTDFASNTDWEALSNLTMVYTNTAITFPAAGQWLELTLSTPFEYTGGNLIVAVDENAPGYGNSAGSWQSYTSTTNSGIYYYNDDTNPDPASPPSANSRTNNIPQIQFDFLDASPCQMPLNLILGNLTRTSINATWTAPAGGDPVTGYNYELRTSGAAGSGATGLEASGAQSGTTLAFNSLTPGTAYTLYVQTDCGSSESYWKSAMFTTPLYEPITITSMNYDVIANGAGPANQAALSTTNAVDAVQSGANFAYISRDFSRDNGTTTYPAGLPNDRIISVGTKYWKLSDYSQNNALKLGTQNETDTLKFFTPRSAKNVYILAVSGSGSCNATFRVLYNDDTYADFPVTINDWYGSGAILQTMRVSRYGTSNPEQGTSPAGPNMYETVLNLANADTGKTITGIKVTKTNATGSGYLNVFAVSINPSATACDLPFNLASGNVSANTADISWEGTASGYQLSYGEDLSNPETGTFINGISTTSSSISSLSPLTSYNVYVRSICGTNPGDTSFWAGPLELTTLMEACTGTPDPGATLTSNTDFCVNGIASLSLEDDYSGYSGITYQWQSSANGTSGWTDITDATNATYVTPLLTETTWYRAKLTCSGNDGFSDAVSVAIHPLPTVTVNPGSVTYCDGSSAAITASGAQTYTWTPAAGLDVSTGAAVSASPTDVTTYTVNGTDAFGCEGSATVMVSPLSVLVPEAASTPDISCASGVPVTIDVTPVADGAGSVFEYELRDASGAVVAPWQSAASFVFTPAEEGDLSYQVFVKTTGCTGTSDTGFVTLYYGFDADVTAYEEDCSGTNSMIIINNPEGAAGVAPAVWQNDFESPSLPAEVTLYGNAVVTGGRAVITPSATGIKGAMSIVNIATINPQRLELSFELTADQVINNYGTGGADGLAWSFGDDADYSTALTNGAGSKLRLVFDAANNGTENGNATGIYLTYGYSGNTQMGPSSTGVLAFSPNTSWKNQTDKLVSVVIDEDSKLTMSYDGNVIFDEIQLPAGYTSADKSGWKHLFTAFTGGDALRQAIDDLNIAYINRTFMYGISAGGSGTVPSAWQLSDTFSSLITPDSFDVWIASGEDPVNCHKLLGTYRFIHPVDVTAISATDLTTCGANDGSITLEGLIPEVAYEVSYVKDLVSQSATVTSDLSGNLILDNLLPGVYSNIVVSVDGCSGAPLGPVTIVTPVKPALTVSGGDPNTDCSVANGTIILSSPGFVNGTTYDIWYNGTQHGTLNADINQQVTISGLAAGTYSNIFVVTPQMCNSDTVLTQTVTGAAPSVTISGATATDPSDCNAADGMIELSGVFVNGSLPEVTYKHNGVFESTLGFASATTIQLMGLTAGVYDSIRVNDACPSNTWGPVTLSDGISGTGIATTSATETNTQGSGAEVNYANSTCQLIATVSSSDSLGSVTASVTVSGGTQMYNGIEPYIGRYYDLAAANNMGGTVTIYFTDAEINAYNTTVNGLGNAMYPAIGGNGENLQITAYHSPDPGSGPDGYDITGSEVIIPISVVHNGGIWEITFTTSSFSGFFAHTNLNSTPLPVKLADISAQNLGATNRVDWSTTEEAQGDRFVIERSAEGKHFEAVGSTEAKGISGSRYSFVDATPLHGINYYRVEVLNNDGSRFYSKVVSATVSTKGLDIEAYPNPVKDELTVRANGVVNGTGTLLLMDVSGRVVGRAGIESNGIATFSMDHLSQGMYILKFQDDSTTQTIRVNKK